MIFMSERDLELLSILDNNENAFFAVAAIASAAHRAGRSLILIHLAPPGDDNIVYEVSYDQDQRSER
jgi:hypothetical protein